MKAEFDREIEALLRGQKASARGGSARSPALEEAHLDADELSAYAENALPAAARSRYTAHLADCDDCRRIMTGVALASGAAVAVEKRAAAANATPAVVAATGGERASKSLTGWLAALFSPRALRYAVPLLAVALTGVVAYVALRSRDDSRMLAGRSDTQTQRPSAVAPNSAQESPATATTGTADANANESAGGEADRAANAAPQSAAASKDEDASGPHAGERAKESQSTPSAVTVDGITSSQPSESAPLADANKSVGATADTAAPVAAAPPPKPSEEERAEVAAADARRADNSKREADNYNYSRNAPRRVGEDEVPGDMKNETKSRARPQTNAGRSAGVRAERDGGELASRSRRQERSGVEQEGESEPRASVAGYQFRRRGGAWVDVRYSSSMSASVIGRGSEHFRTLAADFPELERITSQLSGTVVVILGGRAYRIN
ncbi:MAG TPA: zf-HC2 domain-containing protein [Pyrinomonadaceae bacterium]|nr:zf-HC2 domain-containing protein [Pyrinomonadaceae bacterium]